MKEEEVLATKWLRVLPLPPNDKIRNHLDFVTQITQIFEVRNFKTLKFEIEFKILKILKISKFLNL